MARMRLDCKIYVGDLPRDAEEREIERVFKGFGRVRSVWVARNPSGFAFVEMEDPRDAKDAARGLDGATICGVRARVEMSTGQSRGGGGGGGGFGRGGGRPMNPNDRCYDCGEPGHYAYACPRKRGGGGGGGGGGGDRRRRSPSYSPSRSRSRSRSRSPPPRRRRSRSSSSR